MNEVVSDSIGIDAPLFLHAERIAVYRPRFAGGQVLDVRLPGKARRVS
jgi:hypothetical protein